MYLIASRAGIITGKLLAKSLGLQFHNNVEQIKSGSEVMIRYGNAQQSTRIGKDTDCNSRDSILKMSAKHLLWQYLEDSGIMTPRYYRPEDVPTNLSYPYLARSKMHRAGKDIIICNNPWDTPNNPEYIVPYYPTLREYRVHVAFGNVVKVLRKYAVDENSNEKIRTSTYGWRYNSSSLDQVQCAKAMVETALNTAEILDAKFCGIDMAWSSKEHGLGKWIVWEVNSAPSLNSSSLKLYTDLFKENLSERLRKYEIYKSEQNNARNKTTDRRNERKRPSEYPIPRPRRMRKNNTSKVRRRTHT